LKKYTDGFPVAALIYCHRITDNRSSGSVNRNLRAFGKLTGSEIMKKVVLLQTMWDVVNPEVGERRGQDLKTTFWKPFLDAEATIERFHNTPREAWDIVSRSVDLQATLTASIDSVLLQEEMVEAKKMLGETEAGKELYEDYKRLL